MKIKQLSMMVFLAALVSSFVLTSEENKTIFKFDKSSNITNWRILNDVVMGGVSSATFELSKEGKGVFEGRVSTANNGGFASVRYSSKVNLGSSKSVLLRLKGDGKNYQFRIKKRQSDFESYITTFPTTGDWETIEIKLQDLYPSFRGRKLKKPNFNETKFEELSFLIANKKNESFKLTLESIQLK